MVLYLGLGAAVVIAIIVAFFVLRSGRFRDRDEGTGMERDPRSRHGRFREPPDDEEDWSIDDYRSAHPIRGKYAAPSGAGRGGHRAGGPGPAGPASARRAPAGRGEHDGRGERGEPAARGYQPAGYPGGGPGPGADQYDRATAGHQQGGYGATPNGYGSGAGGYPAPRAARDDWQQPGPGYAPEAPEDPPSYPDAEPAPAEGKKKGRGKRFRLGRRDDEADIWPDDEVSDEDYWASVATEKSLPSTDQPRSGGPHFSPAGPRPTTADARPSGLSRHAARPQATPRPAAGLAMPSTTASSPLGATSGPGMNSPGVNSGPGAYGAPGPSSGPGMSGGPGASQRPGAGRYGGRDLDPRGGRGPAPRPEPDGYPDPRDVRPSARPPSRHGSAAIPPDRYQAALTEQTETFSMPDGVSPQAPTAQYPSRGGGRHSRPDDRDRSPYPYGQPPDSAAPHDPAYRRDRR
jgi:DNA polymerase-3 subunit gamma/tau